MATTPRERLDREKGRAEDYDAAAVLLEFADTLDTAVPGTKAVNTEGDPYDCQPRTTEAYLRCVRIAIDHGLNVLEADTEAVNDVLLELAEDRSDSTMVTYQAALRAFYIINDLNVEPTELVTFNPDSKPRHDEQDMFTEDEVFALREAVMRTANPIRNRALFELLLFTGQRLRALVTLRCRDIDLDDRAFYLNPEVDGLKGARQRGRRRPLLGARKYVRDWLDAHPTNEGWLFIGNPNHWRTAEGDHLSETTVDQILRRVADDAGVDKPVNAHAFRHYTATILRRDYEMGWDRIGALFGVVEGSNMPETTYAHIDDDQLMRDIEIKMGYSDDERSRFTPPVCPVCDEVLKSHWRQCPACREVFAPDAESVEDFLEGESVTGEDAVDRMVANSLRRLGYGGTHNSPSNTN